MKQNGIKKPPHSWQEQLELEAVNGRFVGRKEWVQAVADTGEITSKCIQLFGIPRSQLDHMKCCYGIKFETRHILSKANLAPLVKQNLSPSKIAKTLGKTRAGIDAALRRLNLTYPTSPANLPVTTKEPNVINLMAEMAKKESAAVRRYTGAT